MFAKNSCAAIKHMCRDKDGNRSVGGSLNKHHYCFAAICNLFRRQSINIAGHIGFVSRITQTGPVSGIQIDFGINCQDVWT